MDETYVYLGYYCLLCRQTFRNEPHEHKRQCANLNKGTSPWPYAATSPDSRDDLLPRSSTGTSQESRKGQSPSSSKGTSQDSRNDQSPSSSTGASQKSRKDQSRSTPVVSECGRSSRSRSEVSESGTSTTPLYDDAERRSSKSQSKAAGSWGSLMCKSEVAETNRSMSEPDVSASELYTCRKCNETYPAKFGLYRHASECRPHKCDCCPASFKSKGHLMDHRSKHTGVYLFNCNRCAKGFNRRHILETHKRSKKCRNGPKRLFNTNGQRPSKRYIAKEEKEDTDSIVGPASQTECTSEVIPHRSVSRTHGEEGKSDDLTGRGSAQQSYLCEGLDEGKAPHVCPVCKQGFKQSHLLLNHIWTHSTESSEVSLNDQSQSNLSKTDSALTEIREPTDIRSDDEDDFSPEEGMHPRRQNRYRKGSSDASSNKNRSVNVPAAALDAYICRQCHEEYPSETDLERHEPKCRPYKCTHHQCSASFRRKDHLKEHSSVHTRQYRYPCDGCHRGYNRRRALDEHKAAKTCMKSTEYQVKDKKPASYSNIIDSAESNGSEPVRCQRQWLDTAPLLERSMCKGRAGVPKAGQGASRHIQRRIREKYVKKYKCCVCSKRFTCHGHLQTHLRVHNGQRPFPCHKCEKRFKQKSHLTVHLKTHSAPDKESSMSTSDHAEQENNENFDGIKQSFPCIVCNKQLNTRFARKRHILKEHNDLVHGRDSHIENDPKIIGQDAVIGTHGTSGVPGGATAFQTTQQSTPRESLKDTTAPYICPLCKMSFHQSHDLHVHIRVHTGDKPFSCPHCDAKFSQSASKNAHVRYKHANIRLRLE